MIPRLGLAALLLAALSMAQQTAVVARPTYVTIELEILVNRPAAEVWKRVGKFCDVGEWLRIPCVIVAGKDGELGAVRSAANEILVAKTEFSYTYTQPVRADRPYNLYHGTMEARPVTATTSRIIYSLIYDNSMLADDDARAKELAQRSARFKTALENMKILAEGGVMPPAVLAWPGDAAVQTADLSNTFKGNLSGLAYDAGNGSAPSVMWGVRNGPGTLFRLTLSGANWVSEPTGGWSAGKALRYPDGSGNPDAEGVTLAGIGPGSGLYVSSERNNSANSVSRNSILRVDPSGADASLTATHEWNLTADLPAVGPNLGIESLTWIPDESLVAAKFFDESRNRAYRPADYPNHGTGLFFVGVEANGEIYGYALDQNGAAFHRITRLASGLPAVMDLFFDRETGDLWAVCDDTCQGRSVVLRVNAATGKFAPARMYERPSGMPNVNNEGFTMAPRSACRQGKRPVFWADDSETDGHAIRAGAIGCSPDNAAR